MEAFVVSHLASFLRMSIDILNNPIIVGEAGENKVRMFMILRYDLMGRYFPHQPFSINETGFDFFARSLSYVDNSTPIPTHRPGSDPKNANHDLGWKHYQEWLLKFQDKPI